LIAHRHFGITAASLEATGYWYMLRSVLLQAAAASFQKKILPDLIDQ
jgi:hypothetical protein